MQEHIVSFNDQKNLDDLFMTAADGDVKSLLGLTRSLAEAKPRQMQLWPAEVRDAWRSGIEVILEAAQPSQLQPLELQLVRGLLAVGYDSVRFRDLLAGTIRKEHANYPDPAGLITALGIHSKTITVAEIARRLEVFSILRPKAFCYQSAHALGSIVDVDGFSNSVSIQFDNRRQLTLEVALSSLQLIKPGSHVDKLLRKEIAWDSAIPVGIFRQEAAAALVPHATSVSDSVLEAIMVPRILNNQDFGLFLQGRAIQGAPKATAAPAAAKKDRAWFESRTLEELVDILVNTEKVEFTETNLRVMRELFEKGAKRDELALFFAEAVTRLRGFCPTHAGLLQLFKDLSATARCWQSHEVFVSVADSLSGKLPLPWFSCCLDIRGPEWTADAALSMPYRLWASLTKAMDKAGVDEDLLVERILKRINGGTANPDMLLWLWKSGLPERRIMADGQLVFRTLAKPVHGTFIKAQKDLKKQLSDNEEFQRFLLHDGDPEYTAAVVSCIRHIPLFDKGEQQSLLVKLVRLYPQARSIVEERQAPVARFRPTGKITSFRNFELRRRELEEIIQIQIPANSTTIAHARGYGDLRENAEFKAAKEQQRMLRIRRAELERGIHEVKAVDFGKVQVSDTVVPGCRVTIEYPDKHTEAFTILGVWDGDPEKGIISYETPLGRELLGHKVGDTLTHSAGDEVTVRAIASLDEGMLTQLRGEDLL